MKQDIICIADIQNRIYEAGMLRTEEHVLLYVEGYALLEYFAGKKYMYRIVELKSLKAKYIFSRQIPLKENEYEIVIEKMIQRLDIKKVLEHQNGWERARNLLIHIFISILPNHGLKFRENQLSLALSMLEAMWKKKVALCEAEVGTGKTHAYILAAVVYRLFRDCQTIIISTSTIALQKALTEEYIPQISDILLKCRVTDKPITGLVRKGKSHYACESRLKTYLSSIIHNNHHQDDALIELLTKLFAGSLPIDLDGLPLTSYVKARICVERCPCSCPFASVCRYRNLIRKTQKNSFDFLVVNHNLVFADILNEKDGRKYLLPDYEILIFDEAHKLLEVAKQMYGISFKNVELERLVASIYRVTSSHPEKELIISMCEELQRQGALLFENLKQSQGTEYDKNGREVIFSFESRVLLKALLTVLKKLSLLFYTNSKEKQRQYVRLINRIDCYQSILAVFLDDIQSVCWLEHTGITGYRLCSLPKQLDFILYEDVWNRRIPCILTSATLSVGKNFEHFMHQTGIDLLNKQRILTSSMASPFDYQEQALLYLPKDMPFPEIRNRDYLEAVIERLTTLIYQTHGHTLILFTSYWMMEWVYQEMSMKIAEFPLFCMGKGHLETIDAYRKSRNGVLFASDSAGEGIDLAGDILSSLIVVKLPFRAPDPIAEYEKTLYKDFHSYLSEEIIPGMLIKLRQWIGRGIRRETDTCVFSILDSRAGGRYKNDILSALPDMPVTDQIEDVGWFLLEHKVEEYFE